jgi:hypothetical protein
MTQFALDPARQPHHPRDSLDFRTAMRADVSPRRIISHTIESANCNCVIG